MREHLFTKSLPLMANMAGAQWHGHAAKGGSPLPTGLSGEIYHAGHRRQLCCQEPYEHLGENIEGHDIISAIQQAHEETVALWLAGSWRCNLGSNGTSAPHAERPVSLLFGKTGRQA